MIKLIDFYAEAPQAYFFAAGACLITLIALAIISNPIGVASVVITGAIFTVLPLMLVLRTRRIAKEALREAELKRLDLRSHDASFPEDHEKYDKYMKLRSRLTDTGYSLEETLEKIRKLY